MSWFKKNTQQKNRIEDMTPLEQVTDLLVCLQLADNRIDYSEKEAWNAALKRLFPDYNQERAEAAMLRSFTSIEKLDNRQRINRLEQIITGLIQFYSTDKVRNEILPELVKLIEADGIVMSSESDMLKTIEEIITQTGNYR
ncbi:MAG: TerB family tellurite resistance protein [Candidatus Marinimicrobia bacterium]|nr:TerB family tellurite resistance protein [Candidatus Neomarinimicrobiota bacterium]